MISALADVRLRDCSPRALLATSPREWEFVCMHIGLIGGIGPAATEYYYRGLIERHRAAGTSPDLTIVNADVRDLVGNLASGDSQAQAEIFSEFSAPFPMRQGADVVAVTSDGRGHFCSRELEAISPLPVLNAIPEVNEAIRQRGLQTIGILGNMTVMRSRLYGGITSAEHACRRLARHCRQCTRYASGNGLRRSQSPKLDARYF